MWNNRQAAFVLSESASMEVKKKTHQALLISAMILSVGASPCFAQPTGTKPPLNMGTAQAPSPLVTPGSMYSSQPINPATGSPYAAQTNLNSTAPQSTAINPATGSPYIPQVNMNSPATNNPAVIGNDVSAQPPATTPSATPQTNTPSATTPAATPQ